MKQSGLHSQSFLFQVFRPKLSRVLVWGLLAVGIGGLLVQRWLPSSSGNERSPQPSNYEQYLRANIDDAIAYAFPSSASLAMQRSTYHPVAEWSGRLVLPTKEQAWTDADAELVWLELHNAPAPYQDWIGQLVPLQWSQHPSAQQFAASVTRSVAFTDDALQSQAEGVVHPSRLNGWERVGPLQSLAGGRARDDVIVRLNGPVTATRPEPDRSDNTEPLTLSIEKMPTQIAGHVYALVKMIEPMEIPSEDTVSDQTDQHTRRPKSYSHSSQYFKVQHFNPQSNQFDGPMDVIQIPRSMPDRQGIPRLTVDGIEHSPLNQDDWYIYGAFSSEHRHSQAPHNTFVMQALEPRALVRLQPTLALHSKTEGKDYLYRQNWSSTQQRKQTATSVLVTPQSMAPAKIVQRVEEMAIAQQPDHPIHLQRQDIDAVSPVTSDIISAEFSEGTRALVVHLFGGIGGQRGEAAPFGVTTGHFAYGTAEVIRDPLSQELRFTIDHHQVYAHNSNGILSGSIHWSEYMGNLQRGWQGTRPISDVIVTFPPVTEDYDFDGIILSPFDTFVQQLNLMMARYRVGDGTGASIVTPARSCVQDSNQALYATIKHVEQQVAESPDIQAWLANHPNHAQTRRFRALVSLGQTLEQHLAPLGMIRTDWRTNQTSVPRSHPPSMPGHGTDGMAINGAISNGSIRETENPLAGIQSEENTGRSPHQLLLALSSWRTVLPRRSHDEVLSLLLDHDATLWFLRMNQIGGKNPEIVPRAPNTLLGS